MRAKWHPTSEQIGRLGRVLVSRSSMLLHESQQLNTKIYTQESRVSPKSTTASKLLHAALASAILQ
jgi:hypothetical protein